MTALVDEMLAVGKTWQPIDLRDAIDGVDIEAPELLTRTDQVSLLYRGRVHWIQGESESLKSWLAQLAVAQELLHERGGTVLYVDYEDDERGVCSRLLAMGVPGDVLMDQRRFVYLKPDEPLYDRYHTAQPGALDLGALLELQGPFTLAVIDGVTEAMTTEGLSLLDNADIAMWMRRLPKYLASYGMAVACIDHLTKNREGQGRYAIGGQHKLAGVTGAVYKVTNTRPLARALTDPVTGSSTITVEKDRPGWIRGKARGNSIGVFEVTSYPDGGVTARLVPPDEATTAPPWPLCEAILSVLKTYDGAAKSTLEKEIDGRAETVRTATAWMVAEGWIAVQKVGVAHRHYLTQKGRDQLEGGGS